MDFTGKTFFVIPSAARDLLLLVLFPQPLIAMPTIATDRHYHVYILSSRSRAIYIGVTSDLARRMESHRSGHIAGHTRRYRINRLVYFEETTDITAAIAREKQLKGWRRSKKVQLIESSNPTWEDLADLVFKAPTTAIKP